jgi:twitching motility protein PilT
MIEVLMEQLVKGDGSDLHLSTGQPPYGRFSGELRPMGDEPLTEEQCNKLIFSMLNNSQRKTLEQTWELDCAYGLKGVARFRVNVYRQKGSYAACLRALGSSIPTVEMLQLPPVVLETSKRPRGLVLVTGPTGSGKTTTLAALLDHINHTRSEHILTIEDPIEFIYQSDNSLVHQRQLNEDTRSFANALRAALREDPDVILVGEMRDLETIQLAISAAETGHLVFGTLHTSSAAQTVDRMVDVFPPAQQTQIRVQLSGSLAAVFSQTLCRRQNPAPGSVRAGDGPGDPWSTRQLRRISSEKGKPPSSTPKSKPAANRACKPWKKHWPIWSWTAQFRKTKRWRKQASLGSLRASSKPPKRRAPKPWPLSSPPIWDPPVNNER